MHCYYSPHICQGLNQMRSRTFRPQSQLPYESHRTEKKGVGSHQTDDKHGEAKNEKLRHKSSGEEKALREHVVDLRNATRHIEVARQEMLCLVSYVYRLMIRMAEVFFSVVSFT